MTAPDLASSEPLPRSKRLKRATAEAHERLDRAIMAGEPFANRERYGLFLAVQRAFHRDIDALYGEPAVNALVPDLAQRRRLGDIEQDLADLGLAAPASEGPPAFAPGDIDIPGALGWLYVAEGSNLGAAFLLKDALKLGLSETFGARHLAGAPEGRGLHWRSFCAALDGAGLSDTEDARVTLGAEAAFDRVGAHVRAKFG